MKFPFTIEWGVNDTSRYSFVRQPTRTCGRFVQHPIDSHELPPRGLAFEDFDGYWERSVQPPCDEKRRTFRLPVWHVAFVVTHDKSFNNLTGQARRPVLAAAGAWIEVQVDGIKRQIDVHHVAHVDAHTFRSALYMHVTGHYGKFQIGGL